MSEVEHLAKQRHSNTHGWSHPLYALQVRGAQDPFANGPSVGREHVVDVAHPFGVTEVFQLLEVLVEKPLGVVDGPIAVFHVTGIDDVHTHTRCRHCCGVSTLFKKGD